MIMPIQNYYNFNRPKVDYLVGQKERALPYLTDVLARSNNEGEIVESLYIVDRLIENGLQDAQNIYPVLSRFNSTNSPAVQTFLAGIYRKIQVPDAFGPLVAMLVRNAQHRQPICPMYPFDPNEEVGGAVLSYLV